jgi:RNA recognition motif-containing protein
MQDHSTGRSRGFGFVTFESEQSVEDLLSHGNMHDIDGKQVRKRCHASDIHDINSCFSFL